ncbi:YicC/YloC family endoribonuclease [Leptothrix sp. BB-4]
MAVYSMTGFASVAAGLSAQAPQSGAQGAGTSVSIGVELRSVNSRFLDLALRLPDEWRGLEPQLRERVGAAFKRGKIELRLSSERQSEGIAPMPRREQLEQLAQVDRLVRDQLPQAAALSVQEVLHWCRNQSDSPPDDAEVIAAVQQCIERLRDARAREGDRLVKIMAERIDTLRRLATQAVPLVPQVVARQQQRFIDRWNEALQAAGAAANLPTQTLAERALAEATAYALRIDVAEELSRLGAHLDEIERLLKAGGEVGKRLDFLIQELHREANTLGSKSAALELTQISVEMKVAIEQLREQVQNLE